MNHARAIRELEAKYSRMRPKTAQGERVVEDVMYLIGRVRSLTQDLDRQTQAYHLQRNIHLRMRFRVNMALARYKKLLEAGALDFPAAKVLNVVFLGRLAHIENLEAPDEKTTG